MTIAASRLAAVYLAVGICFGQTTYQATDRLLPQTVYFGLPMNTSLETPAPHNLLASPPEPIIAAPEARKSHAKTWWLVSGLVLTAASMSDLATSLGHNEANPLLQNSSGRFSMDRAVSVKLGLTGITMVIQSLLTRHRPGLYGTCIGVNAAASGIFAGTALHNANMSR